MRTHTRFFAVAMAILALLAVAGGWPAVLAQGSGDATAADGRPAPDGRLPASLSTPAVVAGSGCAVAVTILGGGTVMVETGGDTAQASAITNAIPVPCGTAVRLTAQANANWRFAGWEGAPLAATDGPQLLVAGDGVTAIRARFEPAGVRVQPLPEPYAFHGHVITEEVVRDGTPAAPPEAMLAADNTDPVIDVWYGLNQQFGVVGHPQKWVDVLGNVTDADGDTVALTYQLNGGPATVVFVGTGNIADRRTAEPGDFIIQIDRAALNNGANTVAIRADDGRGGVSQVTVTVNYVANSSWPLPYTIDWSTVSAGTLQQVVQVADGQWTVGPNGVRTAVMAYDRLLTLGEVSWQDFDITVPITIHDARSDAYNQISVAPGVGIIMRWQGHTNRPSICPPPMVQCWWVPQGETAWYDFGKPGEWAPFLSLGWVEAPGFTMPLNVTYIWKVRVETLPDGKSRYRLRVWPAGEAEPTGWLLQRSKTAPTDTSLLTGSIVLVAHQLDVTFGDVAVTRLGGAAATPTPTAAATQTPTATATPGGPTSTPTATPDPGQCPAPISENLIRNGDFEAGGTDWSFYSDAAGNSFSTTADGARPCGNVGRVALSNSGSNIQLFQFGMPIQAGTEYRLRFAARANSPQTVGLYLQLHDSPYTNLGLSVNSATLTDQWQTFDYLFTATESTSNARLRLWLANGPGGSEFSFDDVVLAPAFAATPTSTPLAPTATPTATATAIAPTATPTATATATSVAPTATPTATATATSVAPTATPTATATATSAAPTATPTATATATSAAPTATPTATATATATAEPSLCPAPVAGNLIRNGDFEVGRTVWSFYSNAAGSSFTTATDGGWPCGNVGRVALSGTGNNIQLYQFGMPIQNGTLYRLRFAARANSAQTIALYLQLHDKPYSNLGLSVNPVNLTTGWQTYDYLFTATGGTSNARLRLWLANSSAGSEFYFDDVVLAPAAAFAATATPAGVASPTATPTATATAPAPAATPTATAPAPTATATAPAPTAIATAPAPTATATATPGASQCPQLEPGNLLRNGDFTGGEANWVFYSNAAGNAFAATTEAGYPCGDFGRVAIANTGSNIQLYQSGFAVQSGQRYRLRFDARASGNREIGLYIQQHRSPYANLGLSVGSVPLTASWQTVEMTFVATGTTTNARLRVWLSGIAAGSTVDLDHVELTPLP